MMSMAGGDIDALRAEIVGHASSDGQIRAAIGELYSKYGYISDPHSAAGYNAAVHYGVRGFWLSTASAAKFGEVIEPVLGVAPEIPERLARLVGRPKISTPLAPDSARLKDFVARL
jgi:threonine synthase